MSDIPLPEGFEWRPGTVGDAEAIAELQDACYAVDNTYRQAVSEIEERFESPMLDPATDSLLGIIDGTIVVSIWNHIVPDPVEAWNVYDDNYVHPDHRTPKLSDFVLDWWENRALERVATGSDDLPVIFHQHFYPETQEESMAWIESRGYAPAMYLDELRRDLSQPIPDLAVPDGLRLVNHATVPAEDALALRNQAFADHRGSQPWTLEMWKSRQSEFSRPDASFAVLDDDTPVAYAVCAAYPHDWDDRGYSEGWIEGVGTARSHRGMGLASIVICEAMKVFAAEGLQFATLEVDTENPTGAAGLYANLGFERVRGFIDYTRRVMRGTHDG